MEEKEIVELSVKLDYVIKSIDDLALIIKGNGKPGLATDVHDIKKWHESNNTKLESLISEHCNKNYTTKIFIKVIEWIGMGGMILIFTNLYQRFRG